MPRTDLQKCLVLTIFNGLMGPSFLKERQTLNLLKLYAFHKDNNTTCINE